MDRSGLQGRSVMAPGISHVKANTLYSIYIFYKFLHLLLPHQTLHQTLSLIPTCNLCAIVTKLPTHQPHTKQAHIQIFEHSSTVSQTFHCASSHRSSNKNVLEVPAPRSARCDSMHRPSTFTTTSLAITPIHQATFMLKNMLELIVSNIQVLDEWAAR